MFLQQRSDMKESRFLIPSQETGINYSKIVTEYLNLIKLDLGKTTGRMWFTGRNQAFVSSPMGKNSISKVIFLFLYHYIILYYYIYTRTFGWPSFSLLRRAGRALWALLGTSGPILSSSLQKYTYNICISK